MAQYYDVQNVNVYTGYVKTSQFKKPLSEHRSNAVEVAENRGQLVMCKKRWVCPESASQFLHRKVKSRRKRRVEKERLRVFMSGATQLDTVETNTSRTAMSVSRTLMSLPIRVRTVAFSRPSSCTTCCCCCCSSILEMRV